MTVAEMKEAARSKFMRAFDKAWPMASSIMRRLVGEAFLAGWNAGRRSASTSPTRSNTNGR